MAQTETLDFELEIEQAGADGLLQVNVLNAPGGDASLRIDPAALPPPAPEPPATLQEARTVGGDLFNALFQGDIRSRYDVSRRLAQAQKAALRIRLRIEPPEVAALPWELLFDARSDEFLALSRSTPVVRYIPSSEPVQPLTVKGALNVLLMGASPQGLPAVNLAQERARIEEALAPLRRTRRVSIQWIEGQNEEALRQALQAGEWHAFHYIGHAQLNEATGNGELLLAGADGSAAPLEAATLRSLLRDHGSMRLAVLNACEGARSDESAPFASLAAQLVQGGLPAVVAMQSEITADAAGRFTSGFYGALAQNLPLDAAVSEARKAMRSDGADAQWSTPALYLRARDGRIWKVEPGTRRQVLAAVVGGIGLLLTLWGLWALVYFWAIPHFWPTQMLGDFGIAVAQIGVLGENGRMSKSALGETVSNSIYRTLDDTYQDYREALALNPDNPEENAAGFLVDRPITIWHDSLGRAVKNVTFGMIEGATPQERKEAAAKLADHIGAEIVVYGHIDEGENADEVTLEFYYDTPSRDGEPDATAGNHNMGLPISSRVSFNDNPDRATLNLRPPLAERTQILFWITQALSLILNNQPEDALTLLEAAEGRIRWNEQNGRDLFELVRGQAALLARDLPTALASSTLAAERNSNYVNALMLKGQTLYDWAQLFYLRDAPIPEAQATCYNTAGVENAAASLEEARAGATEAVETLQAALAKAESFPPGTLSPQTVTFIHMSLGLAWRIVGYTQADSGNSAGAAEAYVQSAAAFDEALNRLSLDEQPQYVGWTLAGLGATQEAQWDLLAQQADEAGRAGDSAAAEAAAQQSLPFLRQAVDTYQACVELEGDTENNEIFQTRVLECACKPFLQQASETLSCLEGGPCSQ